MNDSSDAKPAILVTGAADRLGAEIARGLAANGFLPIIHYNSAEAEARDLAAELDASGCPSPIIKADLLNREARSGLISAASKLVGPLKGLINNASIFEHDSIETLAEDFWDMHFRIHAETPVFLARDFAAQLPEKTRGNIINIIDQRVWRAAPASFSYHLSKSVLWTATQTLAQSFAPAIRVNAVGPGPILPEAGQSVEDFHARGRLAPLGEASAPHDAVAAVVFLLKTPSVTGQMIAIDGGEHIDWPPHRSKTPRQT